jgi:hypothetical protein
MSECDSEDIRELLESSSEEDEEKEAPFIGEEENDRRFNNSLAIGEEVMRQLPPEPELPMDKMGYFFYYSIQYLLLYNRFDGMVPVPDYINDSDEVIREKSYYLHLMHSHRVLNLHVKQYAAFLLDAVVGNLVARLKDETHPLIWFVRQLAVYKELHSRRIKADPAASRTKTDVIRKTYNAVTGEEYNPKNPNHKWHLLILHPLPSDLDPDAKDPKEGGFEHYMAIEVDKLEGRHRVPEPFSITVTPTYDTLFRMLHVLLHFDDYVNMYVIGSVALHELIGLEGWRNMWTHVLGEYADTPIQKLSREKKGKPPIVSRIAEMFDILKEAVLLRESLEKK